MRFARVTMTQMKKLVCVCVLASFTLVFAASAQAYIFWSAYDSGNSKVGRAALDATGVNPELVKGIYFGQGVATDGTYVYWGGSGNSPSMAQIGRARTDGSESNYAFQPGMTYCGIFDIVATPTELFWLKSDCTALEYGWDIDRHPLASAPGEYKEVGSGSYVCGFDIDANYVYWAEKHFIARAPLPGPTVSEREWLDLGTETNACALAVSGGYIYYTRTAGAPTYRGSSIGRVSTSGDPKSINNNFITGTSFTAASGIDVAGDYIYWANSRPVDPSELNGYIGRASLDGTGVAQFFIGPVFNPTSIDVDATGPQPAPPGSKGTGVPPPPPGPMRVVAVGSSNSSWAPGSGSTAVRLSNFARAAKSVPRGTVFSYTLNQDAAVTIEILKKKAGRLVGKKCKKPTKANKKKKKCDLPAHAPLSRSGSSGKNEVPYSGRVKGKALTVGRYNAVVTAKPAAGASSSASVGFKIVKP